MEAELIASVRRLTIRLSACVENSSTNKKPELEAISLIDELMSDSADRMPQSVRSFIMRSVMQPFFTTTITNLTRPALASEMAVFGDWFFSPSVVANEVQSATLGKLICERRIYALTLEAVLTGANPGSPTQKFDPTVQHLLVLLQLKHKGATSVEFDCIMSLIEKCVNFCIHSPEPLPLSTGNLDYLSQICIRPLGIVRTEPPHLLAIAKTQGNQVVAVGAGYPDPYSVEWSDGRVDHYQRTTVEPRQRPHRLLLMLLGITDQTLDSHLASIKKALKGTSEHNACTALLEILEICADARLQSVLLGLLQLMAASDFKEERSRIVVTLGLSRLAIANKLGMRGQDLSRHFVPAILAVFPFNSLNTTAEFISVLLTVFEKKVALDQIPQAIFALAMVRGLTKAQNFKVGEVEDKVCPLVVTMIKMASVHFVFTKEKIQKAQIPVLDELVMFLCDSYQGSLIADMIDVAKQCQSPFSGTLITNSFGPISLSAWDKTCCLGTRGTSPLEMAATLFVDEVLRSEGSLLLRLIARADRVKSSETLEILKRVNPRTGLSLGKRVCSKLSSCDQTQKCAHSVDSTHVLFVSMAACRPSELDLATMQLAQSSEIGDVIYSDAGIADRLVSRMLSVLAEVSRSRPNLLSRIALSDHIQRAVIEVPECEKDALLICLSTRAGMMGESGSEDLCSRSSRQTYNDLDEDIPSPDSVYEGLTRILAAPPGVGTDPAQGTEMLDMLKRDRQRMYAMLRSEKSRRFEAEKQAKRSLALVERTKSDVECLKKLMTEELGIDASRTNSLLSERSFVLELSDESTLAPESHRSFSITSSTATNHEAVSGKLVEFEAQNVARSFDLDSSMELGGGVNKGRKRVPVAKQIRGDSGGEEPRNSKDRTRFVFFKSSTQ